MRNGANKFQVMLQQFQLQVDLNMLWQLGIRLSCFFDTTLIQCIVDLLTYFGCVFMGLSYHYICIIIMYNIKMLAIKTRYGLLLQKCIHGFIDCAFLVHKFFSFSGVAGFEGRKGRIISTAAICRPDSLLHNGFGPEYVFLTNAVLRFLNGHQKACALFLSMMINNLSQTFKHERKDNLKRENFVFMSTCKTHFAWATMDSNVKV